MNTNNINAAKNGNPRPRSVLVTGHLGLVGRHLTPLLQAAGYAVRPFDIADGTGDVRNGEQLARALDGCTGVVHLAAVSRVVWAQHDPDKCWAVNTLAGRDLVKRALDAQERPWVLAASSREVYGQATSLPVREDSPLVPINIYGRSKVELEQAVADAQRLGLVASIVRLANVYGCVRDHADRALPAFCRAAAEGTPLRVDGGDTLFDFTHVRDAARGLMRIVEILDTSRRSLPPIHLLPGRGASLLKVAELAVAAAGSRAPIRLAPARDYDVSHFVGDPARAAELLGWSAEISLEDGIAELVAQFRPADRKAMRA